VRKKLIKKGARMMSNKLLTAIVIILAVAIIGTVACVLLLRETPVVNVTNPENVYMKENILTALGTGKITLAPDVAYIQVGVETLMKDAKKAQEDNAQSMKKVVDKLKAMGIEDKDIQTSNYHVSVEYDYNNNRRTLVGYRVLNTVRVTLRDVEKVGDVLSGVHEEGANYSYGISFGLQDRETTYKEALQKAIDDAKAKADIMAKQAGVKLKNPVAIYEGSAPQDVYRYERDYVEYESMKMASDAASWSVPISQGEIEIYATATLVYRTD
jgi:uncharacterized protein YggE